ncbi:MAG: hypothetical protein LQ352_004363 [Teloschistes flavicans]|nr:MAG: hypothetical protein LQ352_004363 [Teloschistes flavicans]
MDTQGRKTAESSVDLTSPRSLTSPKEDPETARLLRDLKVGDSPAHPSPPETPKTPRRFLDRFRSGKKHESSGSRGYSPTTDPVAAPIALEEHSDIADQLTDLTAAYNLIGQDYLRQQSNPPSQPSTPATPATPRPSGSTSCPISSDTLNRESPLSQLRFESSSRARQHTSSSMDARFLAPATAAAITMTKQKEKTIRIAKEQQQALQARLQKNDIEMPPFEFLELIGKGAFGRVFKANDLRRNKVVALKVLDVDPQDFKVHYLEKDDSIQSVLHEINILTQLRDSGAKNINLFIEAFSIHSQLWIVTEYCPGGSLHTLMQGVGSKLEERYIIPVARELAIALQASHAAGIIHRDVKAANVMIHENGSLQLIDFGVAGLLQTSKDKRSTIIGTPHWMAPEMSSQLINQGPPTVDYATEVGDAFQRDSK